MWIPRSAMGRSTTMGVILAIVILLATTHNTESKPFPAPDLRRCNMAFNSTVENCCTLPATHLGPQRKFSFQPELPMRIRPAAHLVDDAYIAKYQKAVELMRALPETDGRSFLAQYRLHCAYCNNHLYFEGNEYPLEIHQNWLFFTWHRLYLYFNERILAKLIDDDTFALPFWNWDSQEVTDPLPNVLPRVYALNTSLYANPINKTSSLWHPLRDTCSIIPGRLVEFQTVLACNPQDLNATRAQNRHLLWTQAVSGGVTPRTMFGAPYRYGDYGGTGMGAIESRPHGPVHIWTNVRMMSTNKDSASDPVFFAHHANVDRVWEHWKTLPGEYRKDVTDPDYLNTEFTFYDEDGKQVVVSVKQSLDLDLLRYKYQEIPMKWATQGSTDPSWQFCNPAATSADDAALIARTPLFKAPLYTVTGPTTFKLKRRPNMSARHGEEMLELKLKVNWHQQHLQNIFAFLPNSTYDNTSIGCPEFLGNLFSFPHVGQAPAPELAPNMTYRIGIRRKLELMGRAHLTELVITMVGEVTQGFVPGEAGLELTGARIVYSKA